MINEYLNGRGSVSASTRMVSDEYIEFTITQNMTSEALSALTFGDSNTATSALQGVFQFDQATLDKALAGAGRKDFLAGTLIVVKGTDLGAQNLSYNPSATNISDNDLWSLELVAGQGAHDHPEKLINGSLNISSAGDVVWVSSSNPPKNNADTSGFIDAIGHSSDPGYIAKQVVTNFGDPHLLNSDVPTGSSVINAGDATVVLSQTLKATMAAPNSDTNTFWINGLRASNFDAVPEPSRLLLLIAGTAVCFLRRNRVKNRV